MEIEEEIIQNEVRLGGSPTINVTLDVTLGGDIFHSPRYNPKDFYAKPIPTGVEFKGPLWHPF